MNEFIANIISASFYKINDVKVGVVPLTELQNKGAIHFLDRLIMDQGNGNITLCLRGENYFNLSQKLFLLMKDYQIGLAPNFIGDVFY